MHLSSERFSLIRDDARLLVTRTGKHKDPLETLAAEAEAVVQSAAAAVDGATQRNDDVRELLCVESLNATARAHVARGCVSPLGRIILLRFSYSVIWIRMAPPTNRH
jgi:hypothetical protein